MKVFVAGATGILGRRTVKKLIQQGYKVVGLSRSPNNYDWLSKEGAEPRAGSIFDTENLKNISKDCEVFIHLATSIPQRIRTTADDWSLNDRIRREGTRCMINAALSNDNSKLYIQPSITFLYGDRNGQWVDEDARLPMQQIDLVESSVAMEKIVNQASQTKGLPAVILRIGSIYSSDSATTRAMLDYTQQGLFKVIGGDQDIYIPLCNADDAAEAIVKSIEGYQDVIGMTFNVCDDNPPTHRQLANYMAEKLNVPPPGNLSPFFCKICSWKFSCRYFITISSVSQ